MVAVVHPLLAAVSPAVVVLVAAEAAAELMVARAEVVVLAAL
jgi:hypothetical protein